MRLVCISDVHNQINKVKLPAGDLLCISGDLTMSGTKDEYEKFNYDLEEVKSYYKFGILLIEGNHDWLGESEAALAKALITNAILLRDEAITINELKFWGSPYTPTFYNWSYNLDRGPAIKAKWDMIPNDTDVLITHGPPRGKCDKTLPYRGRPSENVGCDDLLQAIKTKNIRLNIFGHIHAGYGFERDDNCIYVNASTCNEKYNPINPPIIINIDKDKPINEWTVEYYKPVVK